MGYGIAGLLVLKKLLEGFGTRNPGSRRLVTQDAAPRLENRRRPALGGWKDDGSLRQDPDLAPQSAGLVLFAHGVSSCPLSGLFGFHACPYLANDFEAMINDGAGSRY